MGKHRTSFRVLAWSYACLLVIGAVVAGVLGYGSFERNVERQMEKRIEGHAQLIAQRFEPDTLARLLDVRDPDDPLVRIVHAWVEDAARKTEVRRIVLLTPEGRIAIDSADISVRGVIDYSERINSNEINHVIETGRPGSSILYELESEYGREIFKTSYALVPRVPGTVTDETFVAAVEIPLDYPKRLERIRWTVIALVAGFSAFIVLCTLAATKYFGFLQARVEEQTRKAELADFSAAIAHEIKNPLGAMMTGLQLLERKLDSSQKNLSAKLLREVALLDRIVKDFLAFARGAQRKAEKTSVGSILAVVREQLTPEQEAVLHVEGEIASELTVDVAALTQALANLVKNACVAVLEDVEKPLVTVRVSRRKASLLFDVEDNGPGVPEDIVTRLFEPFVSGRSDGTGLGLAIVRRLIEDLGGQVELVTSRPGATHFRIRVPQQSGEQV